MRTNCLYGEGKESAVLLVCGLPGLSPGACRSCGTIVFYDVHFGVSEGERRERQSVCSVCRGETMMVGRRAPEALPNQAAEVGRKYSVSGNAALCERPALTIPSTSVAGIKALEV